MFSSFGWRFWCNCLRFHKGILMYLHSSLFGVCGGIFTILGRPEVLVVQNLAQTACLSPLRAAVTQRAFTVSALKDEFSINYSFQLYLQGRVASSMPKSGLLKRERGCLLYKSILRIPGGHLRIRFGHGNQHS